MYIIVLEIFFSSILRQFYVGGRWSVGLQNMKTNVRAEYSQYTAIGEIKTNDRIEKIALYV